MPSEGDYEGLQALANAAAAQLVPCILLNGLQGHRLSLRLLLCSPKCVPKVRRLLTLCSLPGLAALYRCVRR